MRVHVRRNERSIIHSSYVSKLGRKKEGREKKGVIVSSKGVRKRGITILVVPGTNSSYSGLNPQRLINVLEKQK